MFCLKSGTYSVFSAVFVRLRRTLPSHPIARRAHIVQRPIIKFSKFDDHKSPGGCPGILSVNQWLLFFARPSGTHGCKRHARLVVHMQIRNTARLRGNLQFLYFPISTLRFSFFSLQIPRAVRLGGFFVYSLEDSSKVLMMSA